ncbi:hypothetical protein R9C00_07480 [Flammeovirgaceae bacterium SG7u.111]|nr:hypothetical protein [Flammeovirgaceae bacterium SG7u.132]WPO37287.1 hypothetical protein R9C00_07480 [Flammeovirgaceae bacterium SG7u.111]
MNKTINEVLEDVWGFINHTLNRPKELETAIAAGFTKKQFEDALKLYNKTIELKQVETTAEGRRMSATSALNEAIDALKKHYGKMIEISKKLFKEDVMIIKRLELKGIRKSKYAERRMQIFNFYSAILNDAALLEHYVASNITKEYISEGMKLYKEMVSLKLVQETDEEERSEAQNIYEANAQQLYTWYTNTSGMIKSWKKLNITPKTK